MASQKHEFSQTLLEQNANMRIFGLYIMRMLISKIKNTKIIFYHIQNKYFWILHIYIISLG